MKAWLAIVVLLAAGCASSPPAPEPAPQGKGGYYKDDGPGEKIPPNLSDIPDAQPRAEPLHRFANRPYQVFGKDYVPLAQLQPYRARGIASWYGRRFHGQKTASGEVYDMYAMTAAHATLPIPSYAKVTHLRSGKSVVVRINDRGPFHAGRIIDLSYAAAHRLGFVQGGSAEVEVESILPGAKQEAQGATYLQVGAFASRDNAENLRQRLITELASMQEAMQVLLSGNLWRLQLGPYASADDAKLAAERIERAVEMKPLVVVR